MKNSFFSIQVIDSVDNFSVLQNIIDNMGDMIASSATLAPSLRKYWLTAFIQAYGSSRNLAITVVFENNTPKLLMPFQKKPNNVLEFLCDETSDYNDFFYGTLDINLVRFAIKYWVSLGIQSFYLERFPSDSESIKLLCRISEEMHWKVAVEKCDTIPIIIASPEEDVTGWTGAKKHAIKRYKRKQIALEKESSISFSFIETSDQLIEIFPEIQKLHISRWELNGAKSKYMDSRRELFIMKVCQESLREKSLFFPIMKIDASLAAFIIGFRSGKTIYDWNTSFSVDYFRWSPGALLLLYVLSNSRRLGYIKYNLMKGTEQYKYIWTNKVEENLTLKIELF